MKGYAEIHCIFIKKVLVKGWNMIYLHGRDGD